MESRFAVAQGSRREGGIWPSDLAALSVVISGIALCLVSLYLLRSDEEPAARPAPATFALPQAEYVMPEEYVAGYWGAAPTLPQPEQPDAAAADEEAPEEPPSPIVRVRVPGFDIDAPIQVRTVDETGAMQNPHGPEAVAWYDFSALPGQIGNIVMAGHVDYYNYGPAVFWRLRDLKEGDVIELVVESGEVFTYEVSTAQYYTAADAPVNEIVGAKPFEALTLITCGGSFDSSRLEYDERLVVQAKRVDA